MKHFKPLFIALIAFAAAACETAPSPKLPELTFTHLPPLTLGVSDIEIQYSFKPAMKEPYVDHVFPVPPQKALRQWATDRLKSRGGTERARFIVLDGSIKEEKFPVDQSFSAHFKKEQSERYEASVEAVLEFIDANGVVKGSANAKSSRSTTVREDASLNDREKIKFELVEKLMADFNAEMEKNIRRYAANWIR